MNDQNPLGPSQTRQGELEAWLGSINPPPASARGRSGRGRQGPQARQAMPESDRVKIVLRIEPAATKESELPQAVPKPPPEPIIAPSPFLGSRGGTF